MYYVLQNLQRESLIGVDVVELFFEMAEPLKRAVSGGIPTNLEVDPVLKSFMFFFFFVSCNEYSSLDVFPVIDYIHQVTWIQRLSNLLSKNCKRSRIS